MSFLSRLFGGGRSGGAPKDIDAELARLEAEAENARPGYVGTAFNKAGDLALKDDQGDRAVSYYGRAIDAFLEDGQRELARGVANKIIRVRPAAIRTLCTLTWLDLAARHQAMALLHLRDYTNASKDGGFDTRAATQVWEMARISVDSQFVIAAADALDSLGFPNRAKMVRSWAADGAPDAITDGHAISDACLDAAIRSNDPESELLTDDLGSEAESSDEGEEAEAAPVVDEGDSDTDAGDAASDDASGEESAAEEAGVEEADSADSDARVVEDAPDAEAEADDAEGTEPLDGADEPATGPKDATDTGKDDSKSGPAASPKKGKSGKSRKKKRKKKKR